MITLNDIQGHWIRHWIKAPGFEDHTTHVHWMQVGAAYADVRIPADRPELSGFAALSELPAETLRQLAQAEGFAGHVTLEGTQCTWHREINWHGAPDALDVGAILFDPKGRMIETGVQADYTELWQPHAAPNGAAWRFAGAGYAGYLITHGDTFVLGVGMPDKPTTKVQLEALRSGQVPGCIALLFDGLHAVGQWSGENAVARFATQPFCEGEVVATLKSDCLIWHRTSFDGDTSQIEMPLQLAAT